MTSTNLLSSSPDPDFNQLQTDPHHYEDNYEFGVGYLCRRIFLKNTLLELFLVRDRLKEITRLKEEEEKEEML